MSTNKNGKNLLFAD